MEDIGAATAARGATVPIEEAIVEGTMEAATAATTGTTLGDTTTEATIIPEDTTEATIGTIIEDMPLMEQLLGFFLAG